MMESERRQGKRERPTIFIWTAMGVVAALAILVAMQTFLPNGTYNAPAFVIAGAVLGGVVGIMRRRRQP